MEFREAQKRAALEHRQAWEVDIQEKHRLEKMAEAKEALANDIMTRRAAVFARLKVFFNIIPPSPPRLLACTTCFSLSGIRGESVRKGMPSCGHCSWKMLCMMIERSQAHLEGSSLITGGERRWLWKNSKGLRAHQRVSQF